jgi:Flp pilus assembly protein TadG
MKDPLRACFRVLRRAESGFGVTAQGIFYMVLLWMLFGFVFDLGNVLYVSARLRSSVFAAAQDAAKRVDPDVFEREQRLALMPDAAAHARNYVVSTAPDFLRAVDAQVVTRANNYVYVQVDASASVPMYVLGVFNVPPAQLSARARAEAVSGANIMHE